MTQLSNRELAAQARRIAYRLDPKSAVDRARKAQSERGVSIRPAPDTMSWVTALLPVAQGVAVIKALSDAADARRASGADERTRGQVMADTLVERVTGQSSASAVRADHHTDGPHLGDQTAACRSSARAAARSTAGALVGLKKRPSSASVVPWTTP